MTGLACWLAVVGVSDLLRASRDVTSARHRLRLSVAGALLLLLVGISVDPGSGWWAWIVATAAYVGWVQGSGVALASAATGPTGRPSAWPRHEALAYAAFVVGVVVLLVAGDAAGALGRWPDSLPALAPVVPQPTSALLFFAVVVIQISTANIGVRMLLNLVGVPALENEKALKGGRVLGPMERIFIVLLGSVGEPTAAAVVVAAKALLRFPEVRSDGDGPSEITEYFLVGSFASWLVALCSSAVLVAYF